MVGSRSRFAALVALVVLASASSVFAARAGAAQPSLVVIGPVHVRSYDLSITAYTAQPSSRGQPGSPATLVVGLYRSAGKRVPGVPIFSFAQSHEIVLEHRVRVVVSRDLASASVSANLHRFGRIDVHVSATGIRRTGSCPVVAHYGHARGEFRLAPGGRYFG